MDEKNAIDVLGAIYDARQQGDVLAVQLSTELARGIQRMVGGKDQLVSLMGVPTFVNYEAPAGTCKLWVRSDGSGFERALEHIRAYVQMNGEFPRRLTASEDVGLVVPTNWVCVSEVVILQITDKLRGKVILMEGARQ